MVAGCGDGGDAPPPGTAGDREVGPGGAAGEPGATLTTRVRPGAAVLLADSLHLVRGRRVGLVTNHTGVVRVGRGGAADTLVRTADLLHAHPEVELAALFAPEHGLAGAVGAGERVEAGRDARTGLPVHSLYGDGRGPPSGSLQRLDLLLFDVQDVGARYYTYVWTMALAMRAAGEAGIPFLVLDRPNPLGGELVQGNVLDPAFASFVGLHPVPMRHGMTAAELARLLRGAFGVDVDLGIAPVDGWRRERWFDETGLPWIPPSPNMPSLESAAHYPGTCLFEGTNLSVGRGTPFPFQVVGAPWLDGEALAEAVRGRLAATGLEGVRVEPVRFVPRDPGDGKHAGTEVGGVRLTVTDRRRYDPTAVGVALLLEARRMAGEHWAWRPRHFDRLAGTDRLRAGIDAGAGLDSLLRAWRPALESFEALRRPYLLY